MSKILHINLGGPYNHDMGYQGAILPKENFKAGHEVTVITSCFKWSEGRIIEVEEEDIVHNGIRYIRLQYSKIINKSISEKMRHTKKLKQLIYTIKPDIIMQHDLQSLDLYKVKKYKNDNPEVIIYADSHTDANNSAQNIISKYLLHKIVYKKIIKDNLDIFNKVLCISLETMAFLNEIYRIPKDMLEFYPLGGTIIELNEKKLYRKVVREELNISDDAIVFCHSGKLDKKKKTLELIMSFRQIKNDKAILIIVGSVTGEIKREFLDLLNEDERIHFLGWKSADDLHKIIAASDLYLQPGSQSATMQNALCLGTPVLIENNLSHQAYSNSNAILIDSIAEIPEKLNHVLDNPSLLKELSINAYKFAVKELDYKILAQRITK